MFLFDFTGVFEEDTLGVHQGRALVSECASSITGGKRQIVSRGPIFEPEKLKIIFFYCDLVPLFIGPFSNFSFF